MPLSQGDRLGRYEILAPLGAGGMGEVYRARDTELEREVAVKVLPDAVANDPKRLERFTREAKAVARLSHPNILEIWDFGTEDGVTYAVSELLEGKTLRERVPTTGLPWQKTVKIGARIADGLAAAHSKGVVHRDLKPENIFVTSDGLVKVLDFGLARVQDQGSPDEETHTVTPAGTEAGTILGTVGYMSPEQVTGGQADHRSDIFSLGCVLYEMVSGRRPFEADTEVEVMAAILLEEPPQLSSTGASLPVDMEQAIHRCLEKSPEARFQSAADLAFALRAIGTGSAVPMARPTGEIRPRRGRTKWWAAAAAAAVVAAATVAWLQRADREPVTAELDLDPGRIVVTAFENRTGDPSLDTVGVMAADLISQRIAETGAAEVVPMEDAVRRDVSLPIGERDRGVPAILEFAQQRGAGLVLSGATYLDGEALRLQARVVDAATGDLIYAFEPVTAARDAASEGIDELRDRVVAAVAAHVIIPELDIAFMNPPSTYRVFQVFQRGFDSFGAYDFAEAIAHFERGLETDPDFHLARMFLVWGHSNLGEREAAKHSLSLLEERLGEMTPVERAYVQSQMSFLDGDFPAAMRALRRGLELAPQSTLIRCDLGWRAMDLNRPGEAIAALEPILEPYARGHFLFDSLVPRSMAEAHHTLGNYERELEYAELGLERFPDESDFYFAKVRALAGLGEPEAVNEVVEEYLSAQTQAWSAGWLMIEAARELQAHGHPLEARAMAERAVERYEDHPPEGRREPWSCSAALLMVGRVHDAEDLIVQTIESGLAGDLLIGWLGVIAAIKGDDDRARQISENLPGGDNPRDVARRTYWQAAIAAHLGEKDRAVALLAEAFSQGKRHEVNIHQIVDLEPLWDYPPFQELIRPKG
jgi:tetratricopeptide (TPR) repeat protein